MAHTANKTWTATLQQIEAEDGTLSYVWTIAGSAYPGAGQEKYTEQLTRTIAHDPARTEAATIAAIDAAVGTE